MVEISLYTGLLIITLGWIFFRVLAYFKTKQFQLRQEAVQLLFLINLLVIYRITFHPFAKIDGQVQPLIFDLATVWPFRLNLIPFVNLFDYDSKKDLLLNLIGNCTMFIPTGIITGWIYKKRNTFGKVTLTGFLISLTIEIIQLPFAVRASDVDDLILNTLGCMAGFGIYTLVKRCKKE